MPPIIDQVTDSLYFGAHGLERDGHPIPYAHKGRRCECDPCAEACADRLAELDTDLWRAVMETDSSQW